VKPDIYEKLAATGKYFNTGKVLIGLQHYPRLHRMNRDEEIMQSILLGAYRPYISYGFTLYLVALALVVVALFIACRS
jgi:hypothetical protein